MTISTSSLPGGVSGPLGVSYSATVTVSGGAAPYTWSVTGLPNDFTWAPSAGSTAVTISTVNNAVPAVSDVGTRTVSITVSSSSASASASLSLTVINSAVPAPPPTTYLLSHFGSAGFGGDDTSVFQTALNYAAANNAALEIQAGSYNVSPLSFPANSYLIVDANVTVSANSGYGSFSAMLNISASNVTVTGAGATTSLFQMPLARAASIADGSQFRHCLNVQNASNVYITGISCDSSGGDGLYVRASTSVIVANSTFDQNYRQGSSITGQVNHVYYLNDYFTNTNGTAPQSGIDIEPNGAGDYLLDINIQGSYTNGNAGDGLLMGLQNLTSKSQPVSIYVQTHHSTGNQRYGYVGLNNDPSNAAGAIVIRDSFSDQSGSYGAAGRFYAANGASLTFLNLTVTNPNVNGPDPSYGDRSAVAVIRGGGGTVPLGNVHFGVVNSDGTVSGSINITTTPANTDYYFNFQDYSNKGVSNVTFKPGTLSGARLAPPNGLLQGTGYNSVP